MVLGALVSAVIQVLAFRPPRPPHHPFLIPGRPEAMGQALQDKLADELGLTAEQREKAKPIITRLHTRMMELRLSQSSEADKVRQETDNELLPLLDEKQKEKLAEMNSRFDKFREREENFIRQKRESFAPHNREREMPPGL